MAIVEVGPTVAPSYTEVVENVRRSHPEGLEQLYRVFQMLSGSLRRHVGFGDFEDRLHDVYLLVIQAIRAGKVREPAALSSYIHGVARLSHSAKIGVRARHRRLSGSLLHSVSLSRGKNSPEEQLQQKQRAEELRLLLASLSERDREILKRFYLSEQTREQICHEMGLTDTQFRLAKSRAKQRLGRMRSGQMNSAAAA